MGHGVQGQLEGPGPLGGGTAGLAVEFEKIPQRGQGGEAASNVPSKKGDKTKHTKKPGKNKKHKKAKLNLPKIKKNGGNANKRHLWRVRGDVAFWKRQQANFGQLREGGGLARHT